MDPTGFHRRMQEYTQYSEIKHLAYNIAAMQRVKMFHSLAVLSFLPSEGKTLLCAALAMAYAETCGTKVLVVNTATFPGKNSLLLRDCFNGSTPHVELRTLKELRARPSPPSPLIQNPEGPVVEPVVVETAPRHLTVQQETDFSVLKYVAEDHSKQYGLVILDTMPLQARNKGNVDPLLVARLSEASVVLMSRKFLDAPKLNHSLKLLKDPSLHLIGVIANEEGTL